MVPSDPPPPPTGPRNSDVSVDEIRRLRATHAMRRVAGNPPPPFVTLPLRAAPRDAEGPTRAGPSSGAEASTKSGAEASTSGRADTTITLVSWNIGLRGLRQLADASRTADRVASKDEHGVSRQLGYGSVAALLASLGEDVHVVCLQETKLTGRGDLTQALACPPGWDSAFSVCRDANGKRGKSGYAGVATYFRAHLNVVGAEEGITGVLAEDDERYDDGRPNDERDENENENEDAPNAAYAVGCRGAMGERFSRSRMRELDAEGRCVLVDFGGFVLFNLYVPAITSSDEREAEARADYKRDFLDAAAIRWSALRAAGRNVVLCGDWNVSPGAIDSAHAPARRGPAEDAAFVASNPGRTWLARALRGNGAPTVSEGEAPETNASAGPLGPGPLPALPARLVDVFRATYPGVTGAYTCWNVAAGAQLTNHGSRIDYFLVDPDFARSVTRCGIARSHPGSDHCPVFIAVTARTDVFRNAEDVETRARRVLPALVSSVALARAGRQARLTGFFRKSAPPPAAETYPHAAGVSVGAKRRGDVSIRSFFARKGASSGEDDAGGGARNSSLVGKKRPVAAAEAPTEAPTGPSSEGAAAVAVRNSGPTESPAAPAAPSATATASKETVDAWRRIRERQKPPRCRGHGETSKVRKVTKAGPNFGRVFFACPRPAGDRANGGDCGFFQWAYDRK